MDVSQVMIAHETGCLDSITELEEVWFTCVLLVASDMIEDDEDK